MNMICLDGKTMAKSCLLGRTIFVRYSSVTNKLALSDADRQDITSDVCNGNASQPTQYSWNQREHPPSR